MSTKTQNKTPIKSPFKTYYVYRYLPHNGTEYRKGEQIELTPKQARFYLLNNFIGTSKTPVKRVAEPAQEKA